jgi:hypothetical protein
MLDHDTDRYSKLARDLFTEELRAAFRSLRSLGPFSLGRDTPEVGIVRS